MNGRHSGEAMTTEKIIQPLPWSARPDGSGPFQLYGLHDADGFAVCHGLTRDEAEMIITACNAHQELIAALRGISNAYASDGNTRRQRGAFAVARALLARLDAEAHR